MCKGKKYVHLTQSWAWNIDRSAWVPGKSVVLDFKLFNSGISLDSGNLEFLGGILDNFSLYYQINVK